MARIGDKVDLNPSAFGTLGKEATYIKLDELAPQNLAIRAVRQMSNERGDEWFRYLVTNEDGVLFEFSTGAAALTEATRQLINSEDAKEITSEGIDDAYSFDDPVELHVGVATSKNGNRYFTVSNPVGPDDEQEAAPRKK